jgi:hypothetical protein
MNRSASDVDLSDRIVELLARMHPTRPSRKELITRLQNEFNGSYQETAAKRLGWLISNRIIEERLTLNCSADKIGLTGSALIGISLNIERLRILKKTQYDIINQIIVQTQIFIDDRFETRRIPPIIIREANIVHGSDQFDILLNVLHSNEILLWENTRESESIITYYVRTVLQNVDAVSGTRSMIVASSKAYPMEQSSHRR